MVITSIKPAPIPAHELRVPIDPFQGARHDVPLCRVDRPGEGVAWRRSAADGVDSQNLVDQLEIVRLSGLISRD
jgi:hypothetical protein